MAYVRKKKTKGREYCQLVEGYREDGKVKQRVLAHLGDAPTVEDALEDWPRRIAELRRAADNVPDINRYGQKGGAEVFREKHERGELPARFLDESGNLKRCKAAPHEYETARKWQDVFDLGSAEWYAGFVANLHRDYWEYVERVERLAREADALEARLDKLRDLRKQGKA